MVVFPHDPIADNTYLPGVQFIPGSLLITAITQAYPMAVSFTNTDGNTYIPGQLVRLFIPRAYGMQQANGLNGKILSVDNVSYIFYLDIDSTNIDPFAIPSPAPFQIQPASMSPAGSRNLTYSIETYQVAFLPLKYIGN